MAVAELPAQPPPAGSRVLLALSGISKRYGSVRALDDVSFELREGEVMALLGENGAGKSTLVKILGGLVSPDAGSIEIGDEAVELRSAERARSAGIAVVQQELSLVPTLTAAENVFLGSARGGIWAARRLAEEARPFLRAVGLGELDALATVESLSVAERQLVEIARLLARQARILILDEPTAALSDVEIARVHRVVRRLADEGRSVIYVTHRLGEVFEIGDRATVFRNGRSQPPVDVATLSMDALIEMMLGRRLEEMFPPGAASYGEERLVVRGIEADGVTSPVSFSVRQGEIFGLAGQLGSGAPNVLRAIAGAQHLVAGEVLVDGEPLSGHTLSSAIGAGVAFCSGDRKLDGVFQIRTVTENLTAPALRRFSLHGWLSRRRERALAGELARFFVIDQSRLRFYARTLSGGNQQKVALAKWLSIRPRVLLVEEPTRGVDVGARAEIYAHIRRLADQGLAVVFASSDLPEVFGLADTVATFYRGELVRVAAASELDETTMMRDVTHAGRARRPEE
jgi:ribose transport system ATP-binding protein/rhamnose transport system ATP-binding protein